ncbi:TolC family protein [Salmonirosea aquatica]|uniref:TolC family protein n=1 Tax=Salmonirosea aquatica TaxID=2654236 RepID=A0A7C9FR61_9BACT|nr:TolC family protein [Cytophagaceae bacterium SJW1-29]
MSINKRNGIAVLLVLLSVVQLHAQAPVSLTVGEAVQMSLKNSKSLKLSQSNVDLAVLNTRQIKDSQLPSFSVSGSYLRLNSPNVSLKLGQQAPSNGETPPAEPGTRDIHVNQAMYGMASAALPLFAGFKFKYSLEASKYLEQAAKLDVEHDREAVIQNTVAAYGNLYKARKAVELVQESLKREQERVAQFTNREQNGLLARNDLMKAKLQESNAELALLDAENDLKVTTVNMDLMLGLPENTDIIPDAASFAVLAEAGTVADWEQKAIQYRKDLTANGIRQKAANDNIKIAKADKYPSLALTGGYVALSIPGLATIPNAMNAGLGVKYDVASLWKSKTKIEQARTQVSQLQTAESMLLDQVHVEVNTAYYNYVLSVRKIDVYAKAVEQADENYRITKNKYDNSLVTTTELLDADVAQVQSRINYEAAKADALVAYKKLEQVSGLIQ